MVKNRNISGFTFIELALGLLLISIIGIGLVTLYGKYVKEYKSAVTKTRLEQIREQLLHFVEVNGYLPCPDAKGEPDGYGDRAGNDPSRGCYLEHGRLPWNEIGAPAKDGWGNYFYYRVNDRATSDNQVHNLCHTAGAGAFGQKGDLYFGTRKPYLCTSTKMIMCLTSAMRADIDESAVCPNGDINLLDQPAYVDLMYKALRWNTPNPQPPYIGLFSPPVGGFNDPDGDESSAFIKVYDLNWLNPSTLSDPDPVIDQTRYSLTAHAVVVSFGFKNSDNVWSALTKTTGTIRSTAGSDPEYTCPITLNPDSDIETLRSRAEIENCDGDINFIYDQTNIIDDQLIWIDHNDIKAALIKGGKL